MRQKLLDLSYTLVLRALPLAKKIAQTNYEVSRIALVSMVHKAYYNVLITDKQYGLATENTQRLQRLLEESNIMYENGFVEKIDRTRLAVSLNLAKIEEQSIADQQQVANRLLNYLLGLEIDASVQTSGLVERRTHYWRTTAPQRRGTR